MNNQITITDGKLIDQETFENLVGEYESKRGKDELKYETFSIGVLDLLKHPDAHYFRVFLGRKDGEVRLILASLDNNGKVLTRQIDPQYFDVKKYMDPNEGQQKTNDPKTELLLMEFGRRCPTLCPPITTF